MTYTTAAVRTRADAALAAAAEDLPAGVTAPVWSWADPTKPRDAGRLLLTVTDYWEAWALEALVAANLIVNYRNRTLLVEDGLNPDGTVWYPKTRRNTGDPELAAGAGSRVALAWALKAWTDTHGRRGVWTHTWRHVLECDSAEGDVTFGTASTGACETCFHTYPAVLFWVRCGCGLINVGSGRDPIDIANDGGLALPTALNQFDDLVEEYLASDAQHACWLGWSTRRR